jgi:hypothetical protein
MTIIREYYLSKKEVFIEYHMLKITVKTQHKDKRILPLFSLHLFRFYSLLRSDFFLVFLLGLRRSHSLLLMIFDDKNNYLYRLEKIDIEV